MLTEAQYNLLKIERRSSIPKYVRDLRVQDAYIIAGASTVGHLFNEQELDRDMGVLAGIGAGIAVSVTKGSIPAALSFVASRGMMGSEQKLRFAVKNFKKLLPKCKR